MTRPVNVIITTASMAALTFGLLVACEPLPTGPDYSWGDARVAECAASACTQLEMDNMSIADYSQLAGLTHVTALMLSYTTFSDLADIAPMTHLQELHVGQTEVQDLTGLAAFANLRLLHIQGVNPESWAPLAQLTQLRELAIGHYQMSDFSIIAQLPQLQRLRITNAAADADLSGLGQHRGLLTVDLSDTTFTDISPLLRLPNLRELSIVSYNAENQADTIAKLRARGVQVRLIEPVIIMC